MKFLFLFYSVIIIFVKINEGFLHINPLSNYSRQDGSEKFPFKSIDFALNKSIENELLIQNNCKFNEKIIILNKNYSFFSKQNYNFTFESYSLLVKNSILKIRNINLIFLKSAIISNVDTIFSEISLKVI